MYSHISSQVTSLSKWMVSNKYFYEESNTRSRFEVLVARYDE